MADKKFSRALASNDKAVRDKALEALQIFLRRNGTEIGRRDLLKLHKGLFYCMWMSDKTPVQQELAQAIAELVHCFDGFCAAESFLKTFFHTIQREWGGIDHLRLDKYYSLIRRLVHELLVTLCNGGWKLSDCELVAAFLTENVLQVGGAAGVRYHVSDVLIPELCKVDQRIKTPVLLVLLGPFFRILSTPPAEEKPMFDHCVKTVFSPLLNEYLPTKECEEQASVFRCLDLRAISEVLFGIAADSTEVNSVQREALYDLRKAFRSAAKRSTAKLDDVVASQPAVHSTAASVKPKNKGRTKSASKQTAKRVSSRHATHTATSDHELDFSSSVEMLPSPTVQIAKGRKHKKRDATTVAARPAADATNSSTGLDAQPSTKVKATKGRKRRKSDDATGVSTKSTSTAISEEKRVRFSLAKNKALDSKTSKRRLASSSVLPSSSQSPPRVGVLKPSPIGIDRKGAASKKRKKKKSKAPSKKSRPSAADFF